MAIAIHSMLKVLDLYKSIDFYKKALNMEITDKISFSKLTLVYMKHDQSNFELELTCRHGNKTQRYSDLGYGHISVSVINLEKAFQKLLDMNYRPKPIKSLKTHENCQIRFFFLSDPDGYQIEFIESDRNFLIKKY